MYVTESLPLAQMYAVSMSKETGVAYIHKFSDEYRVSVATASGSYIIEVYIKGKLSKQTNS